MSKRIGIFGGSFNPIHIGHLVIAEAAWQEFGLEKVLFIPSGDTPNKDMHHIDKHLRYNMVQKAIEGNEHFDISPIEREREGPSYTVDTIRLLRTSLSHDCQIFFICGTDAIVDLPNWKYNKELLDSCDFIAASRPGSEIQLEESIRFFGETGIKKIHPLNTPELDISSTKLRELIANKKSARYFIPNNVLTYIKKYHLYEA